jgi:hypothetical protein
MSDPTEVRNIGDLLNEASNQGRGHSLVSPAPQSALPLQNPYGHACLSCGHQIVEQNCTVHSNSEPFVWFAGFNPAGYYHQRCLQRLLDERARQLRETYGNVKAQEAR